MSSTSSSCLVRRPTAMLAASGFRIVPTLNQPLPSLAMARVLVAADAEWLHNEIRSVLGGGDTTVDSVYSGAEVRDEVGANPPDLVILDLQIGTMGGMATCLDLRLEEGAGRLDHVPVLMLLDRRPDVFLARRS